MNAALTLLQNFGTARLAAMGAVAAILIGFFAFVIFQFNGASEVPLYSGLSLDDSIAITKALDTAQIKYQLKSDGTAIFVDEQDVLKTRMKLAESGLPAGGAVGYEIFDKQDTLGTTSFVQSVNQLRALEGELARTIRTLDRIQSVRVHLVLPERRLFQQDQQEPSASIVVRTRGQLEKAQVRAIQHLVASAVPGLKAARVAIVDEFGRLLASGTGDEANSADPATADDHNNEYEDRLRNQIQQIVENVVGPGKAKVQVIADMDYSRVTQTADTFDPNGQVVRSTQTKQEAQQTQADANQVTAGNQVPNAQTANAGAAGNKDQSNNTEEIVNYEISRTTRTETDEGGRVKRLSVAVLVDGHYTTDAQGKPSYTPLAQPELDQISTLIKSAMGYDQKRGDQINVVNLQFAELAPEGAGDGKQGLFDFTKNDIIKLAQWGVLGVVSLLLLLFVARPLVKKVLGPSDKDAAEGPVKVVANDDGSTTVVLQNTEGAETSFVVNSDGKTVSQITTGSGLVPVNPEALKDDIISQARSSGEEQMDQIRRVGELVSQNPVEAALAIRVWLNEGK